MPSMKYIFLGTYHGTSVPNFWEILVLDQSRCRFMKLHFFGQVTISQRPHEQDM